MDQLSRGKIARRSMAAAVLIVAMSAEPRTFAQERDAQQLVSQRVEVRGGEPTRIAVLPNLKANCTNGPLPEIKILTAPAHGAIIARRGRVRTDSKNRCPDTDALAQILFYQAKPNYSGPDEISVEVTNPDGRKAVSKAQIEVRAIPSKPKNSATDL